MIRNINSAVATVLVDTKGDSKRACEVFLKRLCNSRYASSFVLKGDVLMYAMLGAGARKPTALEMVSRIPEQEADAVLASFEDQQFEDQLNDAYPLPVVLGFGEAVVPHPVMLDVSPIWGEDFPKVQSMSVEAVIANALGIMMDDPYNTENAKRLYDIAALARKFECDGRILYEAVCETFERNGTDVTRYPEAFELDEKISEKYKAIVSEDGLNAPSYIEANEIMNELLWPVYTCLLHENEFFGSWSAKRLAWDHYSAAAIDEQ